MFVVDINIHKGDHTHCPSKPDEGVSFLGARTMLTCVQNVAIYMCDVYALVVYGSVFLCLDFIFDFD